jgi:hypothetical protein
MQYRVDAAINCDRAYKLQMREVEGSVQSYAAGLKECLSPDEADVEPATCNGTLVPAEAFVPGAAAQLCALSESGQSADRGPWAICLYARCRQRPELSGVLHPVLLSP